MYDFLVDHALKNVWCTPEQDLQARVRPARLSPRVGVFNQVQILWRTLRLPELGTRFHVYQIGQLHPKMMGLLDTEQVWTTFAEACNRESLMVDLYANSGVELPRTQAWYQVTEDKNLIVAVKAQSRIPVDLQVEDLFVRVYSNAYFNTLRADLATDVIHVEGVTPTTSTQILQLQASYERYRAMPGNVNAFVNGFLVDSISLLTVNLGDVAEFVYDGSVKRVVDFSVGELDSFTSTLDAKHKYLLHTPKALEVQTIDYQDDLDLYLVNPGAGARFAGVYYHRNAEDAVRMVTHRDYAIPTAYLAAYLQARPDWPQLDQLKVRMVVRKAGWERPLVNENSRIRELYKLPDTLIRQAFLGIDSVVTTWTAASLEAASYVEVMRVEADGVTPQAVERAYGYNAISSLLAQTPSFTRLSSNQVVVDVPYGLQKRSTGYEYDAQGILIGSYTHLEGSTYPVRNTTARLVEMIAGDASDRLDEVYGDKVVYLEATANYRMYTCPVEFGVPTNRWVDVSDPAKGKYSLVGNVLTWLTNPGDEYTLVRSDRTMLGYTLSLSAAQGVLRFTLTGRQLRGNTLSTWPLQVPLGELDLWLNGRSLIEGLDYFVKFPQVVIVNKEWLVNPTTAMQRVDVRFSGFCQSDLTRESNGDVGFVQYGQLSHNNRFDIRDDKVLRITVDGALYERSELTYTEDTPALSVLDARNGSPYQIRDIVVPLRGYTDSGTYALRAKSQVIDQKISDYLTLKTPEAPTALPNVISERYTVYSPFFNSIMADLKAGRLSSIALKVYYNDELVRTMCQPYEWLLEFDPSHPDNHVDPRYVVVHAHNQNQVVDVDAYQYKFLSRVAAIYLNQRVVLSHVLRMV